MRLNWAMIAFFVTPVFAQDPCAIAYPPIQPPGQTFLTPQQEGWVGDFIYELTLRRQPVYRQPGITAPLSQIAARLLQFLPPNEYKFQFTLVEMNSANAFAEPGGRIFVSRRLVASAKSEDELAGVIAHEMGHVLARQASVDLSKELRDTLKITSMGDRDDVFAKMNKLLETPSKSKSKNRGEDDQVEADRVSSEATWRAGYDPLASAQFFDRVTGNEGQTGNVVSDFFRATKPESKRYREMLKTVGTVPATCRQSRPADSGETFKKWQKQVADLSPEDLRTLTSTRTPALRLTPAMRPDLQHIKFSPDGKWLLAQDESAIRVFNAKDLATIATIPALGASQALFLNDSARVRFMTGTGRVETWTISPRARVGRADLPLSPTCIATQLSPDGKTVACLENLTSVHLIDIDTGNKVVSKNLPYGGNCRHGEFSPDGSAFLETCVSPAYSPWAYDVVNRKELSLGGGVKGIHGPFTFLDTGRVAFTKNKNATVVSFPEGKELDKFPLAGSNVEAATKGDVLFVRPIGDYAMAAVDIPSRQIFFASTKSAFDRYGETSAAERNSGELALYSGRSSTATLAAALPDGELYRPRSIVHSPDLQWIALSTAARGQIWNLRTGQSVQLLPFAAGSIDAKNLFFGTFEHREAKPGSTVTVAVPYRSAMDLTGGGKEVFNTKIERPKEIAIEDLLLGKEVYREGFKAKLSVDLDKNRMILNVSEMAGGKTLWTRQFQEPPNLSVNDTVVLQHDASGKDAKELLKKHVKQEGEGKPQSVIEVLNPADGRTIGNLVLDEAIEVERAYLAGRTLFIEDSNNRTLAYSLDTGDRVGQEFGRVLAVDPVHARVATSNQAGNVLISDQAMRPVASFEYPQNVIYAGFDGEGKRLLAITGLQDVFVDALPE